MAIVPWTNGGTMDITGRELAGDTLLIGGTPTSPTEDFVINVFGHAVFQEEAEFPPYGIGSITINLADHSRWVGGFTSNLGGGVFITGDGVFSNTASKVVADSIIDVPVIGHGTFSVRSAQSHFGRLEFTHSVSAGQEVTVAGDPFRGIGATLVVDDPQSFRASVTLGWGEVLLGGLQADSYSIKQDMLLLYAGSKVIDRLDLTVSTDLLANNFGVSQTAAGVIVHADANHFAGTPLPIHV